MFAAALLLAQACTPSAPEGVSVGQRAPSSPAIDEDGTEVLLPAEVDGAQTVLFWTSWCGSCGPLAQQLAAGDATLVLVNAGEAPTVARASRPTETPHALLDPDGRLRAAFEVDAVPLVLVIDGDGVIQHRSALAPGAERAGQAENPS